MPGPVFWAIVILSFASRLAAVTKSNGISSKQDSPESGGPDEISHDVIPCSCVEIHNCPSLLRDLKRPITATSSAMQRLQRFTCGFRGFTPFVCCDDAATKPDQTPPGGGNVDNSLHAGPHDSAADGALDPDIIYYPADSHIESDRPSSGPQYPVYDQASSGSPQKPTSLNNGQGPDPSQAYPTYGGDYNKQPTPSPETGAYDPDKVTRPAYGITHPANRPVSTDQYDPTEDNISAVFGTGSSTPGSNDGAYNPHPYDLPTKYPGQYGPTDGGFHEYGKNPTTYLPSNGGYDHNHEVPTTVSNNLPTNGPGPGYNPTHDISTTFGKIPSTYSPNNGYGHTNGDGADSYLPTNNPSQGYDPSLDISTVFGKRPSTFSPGNEGFENANGVTTDSYLPTNNPFGGYDPSQDISTVFGKIPSTQKPNYGLQFDHNTGVTTTLNGHSSQTHPRHDHFHPTENFFTTLGPRLPTQPTSNGAFNPSPDLTTPFNHHPTTEHFFRPTYGPPNRVSPTLGFPGSSSRPFNPFSKEIGARNPYHGISETLVPPPLTSTNPPRFGGGFYDPSDDIAQMFGSKHHAVSFGPQPSTFPNNYPSTSNNHRGIKYDPTDDIAAIFRRPPVTTSSASPVFPMESFYPLDSDDIPKNRTEFKFHLESKTPPGNVTVHVNSSPGQHFYHPKGYYPSVAELPQVTVSYSLHVKGTEMEKKYSDFKDLFFKNFEKAKGRQEMKQNNYNPFYYYQGKSFESPQASIDYGKQPFDGQNIQFSSIVREPRSNAAKRVTRQVPGSYYPFQPLYYASRYQQPYFFGPSGHPGLARTSFQKRASALTSPDAETTETSADYHSYDEYPDTNGDSDSESDTEAVGYRFHHRIQDRHIQNWFRRGNGKNEKNGKNGKKDDSAIVFPSDDYDTPKYYPHTDQHSGGQSFWGKVGSFFTGKNRHREPPPPRHNYPSYPAWGNNNHGYGHVHPGFQYNTEETETFPPTFTPNDTPSAPQDATHAESKPVPSETTPPKEAATEEGVEPTAVGAPAVRAETAAVAAVAAVAAEPAVVPVGKRALMPENACGVSVDERIVGGKAATIGAYPWIARIGYVRTGSDRVLYRCAATLINSVYVLTAAHCVVNLPTGLKMTTIRLGELNEASDPDCDETECADPVQNFTPGAVSVHAAYDTPQFKNDIALIRLDKPVTFSTYVSPICLPFDGLGSKDFTGLKASVAGWGASSAGVVSSNPALQRVTLNVAAMDKCSATFATRTGVKVGDGQLCAGGVDGKDSCEGDSGGALTRPEQVDTDSVPRSYIIGIVSFGAKRCGSDNMPGVYTRVGAYMDWILEKIQP